MSRRRSDRDATARSTDRARSISSPGPISSSGPNGSPGPASTLKGAGRLIRLNLRLDRLRAALWTVGIVGLVLVSAWSVRSLYSSREQVEGYVAMLDMSPAMESINRAMNGPGFGFDHPNAGVVLVNEVALWGGVAFALMGIFLTTRHTRAEEESGRVDLLRSRPIGRHAPMAAAAVVVGAAELLAGLMVLFGLVAMGFGQRGSAALACAFVGVGYVFAAVTAVGAQVTSTGRAATGFGLAAFGSAFLLRAIGDMGSGMLSWLSPLGWAHRVRPFADEQWWVLAMMAATVLVCVAATLALAGRRDLGSGMVPRRPGRANAGVATAAPLGLLLRLQRWSILGWVVGVAAIGVAYGSVSNDIEAIFRDNPDISRFLPTGALDPSDAYLAYTLAIGVMLASGAAIASLLRLRHDEVEGRLELVLGQPVSRWHWLGDHLLVAIGTALLLLTTSGLATATGVLLSGGGSDNALGVVTASVALAPVAVTLVGFATAMTGVLPRFAAASWVVLVWVVVVAVLGDVLRLPHWVRSLSPLHHLPRMPAEAFDPMAFTAVMAVGLMLIGLGAVAFRHRDVPTG